MVGNLNIFEFIHVSLTFLVLGMWCIYVFQRSVIIILIAVELVLLAINIAFISFSVYLSDMIGQVFALLILTVAASESAIGLAILVVYYRITGIIFVGYISTLKG